MKKIAAMSTLLAGAMLLHACSSEEGESVTEAMSDASESVTETVADAGEAVTEAVSGEQCESDPGIDYVCGPRNAEDLVQVGDSRWLIASGMNGQISGTDNNGHMYLIDSSNRSWTELFPGASPQMNHDSAMYPGCPGPLDISNLSIHGLAIRELADTPNVYRLYVTSHGEREAIETFELDARGGTPTVSWTGCVPMPVTAWTNSVAILEDGGLVTTQFIEAGDTIQPVLAGEITGHVFLWRPGTEVSIMPNTETSGANGIEVDEENDHLYVAEYGASRILRYTLSDTTQVPVAAAVGNIHPDNLRWTEQGTLLTSGGNLDGQGWSIYEIDPADMSAERIGGAGADVAIQGTSVALRVGDELWLGTYSGDRVGIMQP